MAILDFPSAPTIGQTYTGPNGAVYTWDGAAWHCSGVLSVGTAAGGDLTGTYPNPTIAPLAVTTAKLAVGAALPTVVAVNFPLSYSYTNVAGTESAAVVSATITVRGVVLVESHPSFFVTNAAAAACTLIVNVKRDGTLLAQRRYDTTLTAGGQAAIAGFGVFDNAATAGSHTYSVTVTLFATAGTSVQTPGNTSGFLHVATFA